MHNLLMHQPDLLSKLALMGIRFAEGEGGGEGTGAEGSDGGEGGGKSTYTPPATQEAFDQAIEARLARERKKYEGHDDFKAKAAQWDALEAEKKTPSEKAIEDARTQAQAEVRAEYLEKDVRRSVLDVAKELRFYDADDALKVIDPKALPLKDDVPDADAIRKAVEKLATEKPHLVDSGRRRPAERPKPGKGEPNEPGKEQPGKGRAAAALRTLRKGS